MLIDSTALRTASSFEINDTVAGLIKRAGEDSRTAARDAAEAAVSELSDEERAEVAASLFPDKSKDRMWVFVAGFVVAGIVAMGLAAIAWGASASSESNEIATSIIVLATGFTSAILGGLLGVWVQK